MFAGTTPEDEGWAGAGTLIQVDQVFPAFVGETSDLHRPVFLRLDVVFWFHSLS